MTKHSPASERVVSCVVSWCRYWSVSFRWPCKVLSSLFPWSCAGVVAKIFLVVFGLVCWAPQIKFISNANIPEHPHLPLLTQNQTAQSKTKQSNVLIFSTFENQLVPRAFYFGIRVMSRELGTRLTASVFVRNIFYISTSFFYKKAVYYKVLLDFPNP